MTRCGLIFSAQGPAEAAPTRGPASSPPDAAEYWLRVKAQNRRPRTDEGPEENSRGTKEGGETISCLQSRGKKTCRKGSLRGIQGVCPGHQNGEKTTSSLAHSGMHAFGALGQIWKEVTPCSTNATPYRAWEEGTRTTAKQH